MVRRKMTTYVDEELLRSAKVLAARRGGKVYEVFEEALRRYLEGAMVDDAGAEKTSLAEALSEWRGDRRPPGVPREKAVTLSEGETLSEAVLAERESRGY
jgi:hypothetical protein